MLLNAKKIAAAGLLAAVSVILVILSAVIESNSLFLIAAASFCVGIACREWKLGFGTGFWIASVLLNLLLAPNKFHVITYACMGLYILLTEALFEKIAQASDLKGRKGFFWFGKYVIFNLMFVPMIHFVAEVLLSKKIADYGMLVIWAVGQLVLFVYDYAYRYFQGVIWEKGRKKLLSFYRN